MVAQGCDDVDRSGVVAGNLPVKEAPMVAKGLDDVDSGRESTGEKGAISSKI